MLKHERSIWCKRDNNAIEKWKNPTCTNTKISYVIIVSK
jgi:hypothetical protein